MYAKVINPETNGRKVYNNAGSSQRCANYLSKEAKEAGGGGGDLFRSPRYRGQDGRRSGGHA